MLDALGNIGDFIAGIGVVVTLVYLAIQIGHNTRGLDQSNQLMQMSADNEVRNNVIQLRAMIAADAELSDIWTRGLRGFAELDAGERARMELLLGNAIAMMFGQFEANKRGLYEFTQTPFLRVTAGTRGFLEFWKQNMGEIGRREAELGRPTPNPDFTAYVESLLAPEKDARV